MFAFLIRRLKALDMIPYMSETERVALAAGTVWVDGEFFSGKPDFDKMLAESYPHLTEQEQAFLDGPVEELCAMIDDYQIYRTRQVPEEVWHKIKSEKLMGLMVPREYGGLGFSRLATSGVLGKLCSRSLPVAILVVIPNSLGPSELLLHYGTAYQKEHYLPRLASGEELPCFALTEPGAGSDAAAMTSSGVVFEASDGSLKVRLTWNKRYITLAPIATLLGLAFKLRDPQNLLGRGTELGITCALVPTDLPGVQIGRRHDAMGIPFEVGPTQGDGVEISVDQIIGGAEYAGRGWMMLMDCLSAGRGISLPGNAAGGAKQMTRLIGAYSAVREQFGLPIGKLEGIEEPLARIAGKNYIMNAARVYTCGAVDAGHKTSVISAIMKYQMTEMSRQMVSDAMDIMGGAGLCKGPRNQLAEGYAGAPISITVEGANILTRTLIIFGQGAVRGHPYAQAELDALIAEDPSALRKALFGHLWFSTGNLLRAGWHSLFRGRLVRSPVSGPTARYYRKLSWASACFAVLTDLAMLGYGSQLKRAEKQAGRFADAISWMYLGFACLRRFEAEGRRAEDLPLVDWALQTSLHEIQFAFEGILMNFKRGMIGMLLRGPLCFWARIQRIGNPPSDRLGGRLARIMREPSAQRDRLTEGVYLSQDTGDSAGRMEHTFQLVWESRPVVAKLRKAIKDETLAEAPLFELIDPAVESGLIDAAEAAQLRDALAAREDLIQVDSFTLQEYLGLAPARAHRTEGPKGVCVSA